MKKAKKILKYLFGIGAGCILAGAVAGGIVSCSNGNTTTTTSQQSTPQTNTTTAYELANRYNTSAIAFKNPQQNPMTLVTTSTSNTSNYSTLISEPNNVIISVEGQPEAVIDVAKATTSNMPDITLDLNPNSTLYQKVYDGTNSKSDLSSLNNLITFSTTTGSTGKISIENYVNFTSSQTFSLASFETGFRWASQNVIAQVEKFSDGLFGAITPTNLWNDLHPSTISKATATFTTTDNIYWSNSNIQTPFKFTIDLLPFIEYSQAHPTLKISTTPTVNTKEGTVTITTPKSNSWELSGIPKSDTSICDYQNIWYANTLNNFPGLPTTSIVLPYNAKTKQIESLPYMYFDNGMIIVGTTAPTSI